MKLVISLTLFYFTSSAGRLFILWTLSKTLLLFMFNTILLELILSLYYFYEEK